MRRVLIVGAGSGVGLTLAKSLLDTHELWTTSNSSQVQLPTQHFSWNAASQEFPVESLPDSLDGFVYCPGSIRLEPFQKLKLEAFREDFELNLIGAVRALRTSLTPPGFFCRSRPTGLPDRSCPLMADGFFTPLRLANRGCARQYIRL